ncbi:PKD domain-containing protein [Mucilaginibacter sp. NFX135]|uniref:PKD domain-containing protein n=1 Tax=Mucilaginibacter sp. NFX135 TaxID=3402687 RepID=UPI003AFA5580
MKIKYAKKTFFLVIFLLSALFARAQTINVGNVDAGPYGSGSSISIPIKLNNGSGCFAVTNEFDLYLSDANGNFGAQQKIGSITGFYATFVNGIIPAGTPSGTGYKLRVVSTTPVITSGASSAFTINNSTGVVAAVSSQIINPQYPEVFGTCNGKPNVTTKYTFLNQSASGASVTATFFNDLAQAAEGGTVNVSPNAVFDAQVANYTVTVKAVNGGIVGTKSYLLMNNVANRGLGATGITSVCLSAGKGDLTFNADITSPETGLQNNYPGHIYKVTWGDGSTSTYTLCEIIAQGGKLVHTYTVSSCGNVFNNIKNVFGVDLQLTSTYCGEIGTPATQYAQVLTPPVNKISPVDVGCINTPITFANTSYPGQSTSTTNTSASCINTDAKYSWYVNGVLKVQNYGATQPFVYTFTTTGIHNVRLVLQNTAGVCGAADVENLICIQNPPKPIFNFPVKAGCSPLTLIPDNTSVIDANCNNTNVYQWVTDAPAGSLNYADNTNANSQQPHMVFSKAGVYHVNLIINTKSCGPVLGTEQTITVDDTPTAQLSADASVCGINQTLKFNTDAGITHTVLGGIGELKPDSYTWTIIGGAFEFTGGTTANSQYPQILFHDAATYTVSVAVKNNCGQPATATQHLTFQVSPTINASGPASVCAGSDISLTGTVPSGTITGQVWKGGTGTFSNANALVTTYTPSAADIAAGKVIFSLTGTTSLAPPCDKVVSTVTVTIQPQTVITSAPEVNNQCSGTALNYHITSTPGSAYSWTVDPTKTSPSVTGYTNGSGSVINDVLTNSDPSNLAIVTYIIQATGGNCNGNPFTLTVHVLPTNITADFTPSVTEGCGELTVQFTNTSVPLNSSFVWNFGDNTPTSSAVNPSHTFEPGTDGKDKTYTVTLQLVSSCGNIPIKSATITVHPAAPVALILPGPLSGCSPFDVTVQNASPGNNKSYTYHLYDPATQQDVLPSITLTDKSPAVFHVVSTLAKLYKLYMVAEDLCGNTTKSIEWPISVSPPDFVAKTFVTDNNNTGCAPFPTSFVNASTGGDIFTYNIYAPDGNVTHITAGGLGSTLNYTFNQAGVYNVSITAANGCSSIESDKVTVTVNPLPLLAFSADVTTGCKMLVVNFTNNTQAPDGNSSASSYQYDWDFGDGSPHTFEQNPAPHTYQFSNTPFTVTLVATNPVTGCTATLVKNSYITVNPPPFTAFGVKPDTVISIPNYRFTFVDQTTNGPTQWHWDFGDGQTSNNQNPAHSYIDTGTYKVTLTTYRGSCDSVISHKVHITGIPGQLYLPNAFMPTSGSTELQKFIAKGSGIKKWHLQVYNNYGQLMWETDKLDDFKGTPVNGDGWDGTFRGAPVQQGVYIWQASATFINGTEWKGMSYNNSLPKRTGTINLIR